jgi:hypothetical protein
MTPLPAPLRWLHSLEWRRGFFDWARSDGVTWVYIFKVLVAAFLTLWLAMRLELPQPRTAMITVFIVMQPQSGQVFAKSFYRFLGTLAGSAVMVLLIALFAQNTELFLGALAIWVGICTAGATRNRNFHRQPCFFEHACAAHVETLAGIGERQLPGVTGQQGDAQLRFQALEVEADHGAGLAQQVGGSGKRAGLDHGLESVESVQADHRRRPPLSKYF